MTHAINPPKQGLYDPQYEHDACGVGFVVDLQKPQIARHRRAGAPDPGQPGAPRRLRLREEHRRRRRHPPADAARASCASECDRLGIRLPAAGRLRRRHASSCRPTRPTARACEELFEQIVREEGQTVLGWRDVPTDNAPLGQTARAAEPVIRQVFIGRGRSCREQPDEPRPSSASSTSSARRVENAVRDSDIAQRGDVLRPEPVVQDADLQGHAQRRRSSAPYFPDLRDPDMETALALVHSRFSTNTFPKLGARASLPLHRPQRRDQHAARQHQLDARPREPVRSPTCSATDLKKLLPIIDQSGSDSAMFDNALELLVLTGRSLPHAVMMMIPEPWSGDDEHERRRRRRSTSITPA